MSNFERLTGSQLQLMINAYGKMVTDRIERGWEATLLTFMFQPQHGPPSEVAAVMKREVERVYRKHVTRIVRNAHNADPLNLPLWICCPDYPVYKLDKQHFRNIALNDGRHYHVIALTPPWSRLSDPLWVHFGDKQRFYTNGRKTISHIHSVEIDSRELFVTDYVLKGTKTARVPLDDVFLLPLSRSEVPKKHHCSRQPEQGGSP